MCLIAAPGRDARRHHDRRLVPRTPSPSAGVPGREPARRRDHRGRQLHRRGGPRAGRDRRPPHRRHRPGPRRRALRPRRCWPRTSRTTPRTRPASWSSRRPASPPPPATTRRTIVVFQRADAPGSLLAILQEFAARAINLTKLESRPTKRGLGDYCFLIDLEGHVDDELVADCLRDLQQQARREVPRLVPRGRRARPRRAPRRRRRLAPGRRLDHRAAVPGRALTRAG